MKRILNLVKWFFYVFALLAIVPAVILVASQTHYPTNYHSETVNEVLPVVEDDVLPEIEEIEDTDDSRELVQMQQEVLLAQNTPEEVTETKATIEKSQVSTTEKSEYPEAPDFTLKDLDGKEFVFSENLGKLTILNFWASWCGPCKREIPDFVELYEKYHEQGLQIVGVSVDRGRSVAKVKPLCEKYKVNYPIVMDGTQVGALYGGTSSIPTTFIINEEGRVLGRIVGLRPHSFFEEVIQKEMLE